MNKFLKPVLPLAVLGLSSCGVVQDGAVVVKKWFEGDPKTVVLSEGEIDTLVKEAFGKLNDGLPDSVIPTAIIVVDARGMAEAEAAIRQKRYEVDFQVEANIANMEKGLARAAKEKKWSYADQRTVQVALTDAGCRLHPADAIRLPKYRDLIRNVLETNRSNPADHVLVGTLNVGKSEKQRHASFRLDLDLVSLSTPELHSGVATIDKELPWMGLTDFFGGLSTDSSRGATAAQAPGPRGRSGK